MPPPPFPSCKTLRLLIHGRVQGVYFRDSMRREAQHLSISGWVRNRGDGTVEAMVRGEQAALDEVTRWAHRGPPMARVDQVDVEPGEGSFDGFTVIRSSS